MTVPDFYGLTMVQVDSAGYAKQFDFFITDSLFNDDQPKGAIVNTGSNGWINGKKGT